MDEWLSPASPQSFHEVFLADPEENLYNSETLGSSGGLFSSSPPRSFNPFAPHQDHHQQQHHHHQDDSFPFSSPPRDNFLNETAVAVSMEPPPLFSNETTPLSPPLSSPVSSPVSPLTSPGSPSSPFSPSLPTTPISPSTTEQPSFPNHYQQQHHEQHQQHQQHQHQHQQHQQEHHQQQHQQQQQQHQHQQHHHNNFTTNDLGDLSNHLNSKQFFIKSEPITPNFPSSPPPPPPPPPLFPPPRPQTRAPLPPPFTTSSYMFVEKIFLVFFFLAFHLERGHDFPFLPPFPPPPLLSHVCSRETESFHSH